MPITFKQISNSRRTPGIETEANLSTGSLSLASTKQRGMLVGQRMSALISTPSFIPGATTPCGVNDCILGTNAVFTGTAKLEVVVKITALGPDMFEASLDGGATWSGMTECASANTAIGQGITIKFGGAANHVAGDSWNFFAFPAGTVAQKVPTAIAALGDAGSYFGLGSVLYRMVKAALATADNYGVIDLNATAMDDGAGNAAAGSVALGGTATGSGSVRINIGNEYAEAGFNSGDTAAVIALAVKGQLDTQFDDLPVMFDRVAGALGTIALISKNLGTCGNDIQISVEITPSLGITGVVTAMTGGTVDPTSLSDALDSFAGSRYHKIAISLNDSTSLGTLSTHLKSICGTASTKFAIGMFGTNNATLATVTALAEAVDYERIQCHYLRGSLSPGYDIAAAYMALATYVDDPSLPLNGCQVFGLNVPLVPSQFNDTEIEELLWAGVSPLIVDEQSCVAVKRSITTNVSDARMLDVTTITGWDYFRFAFVQRCKQVFAQAKNLVSTPAAVKTQALFVAQQCEDAQMGVTGVAQYQDKFTAEKDASDPTRVNVTVPSPIIPGLQRICARFDLYY